MDIVFNLLTKNGGVTVEILRKGYLSSENVSNAREFHRKSFQNNSRLFYVLDQR